MGHGSWKCQKGCGTNLPNLYQTTSFKLIALHHSSCLRVCLLLIPMVVSASIKLRPRSLPIKATPQTPTSGLAVAALQQQLYITWHNDTVVRHSYTTSLLRACQHAVLLRVGSPHWCAAWLSVGCVSRYGVVFAERK